jgi:hypothetical protein
MNFANLSHFSCVLILYPVGKKSQRPQMATSLGALSRILRDLQDHWLKYLPHWTRRGGHKEWYLSGSPPGECPQPQLTWLKLPADIHSFPKWVANPTAPGNNGLPSVKTFGNINFCWLSSVLLVMPSADPLLFFLTLCLISWQLSSCQICDSVLSLGSLLSIALLSHPWARRKARKRKWWARKSYPSLCLGGFFNTFRAPLDSCSHSDICPSLWDTWCTLRSPNSGWLFFGVYLL